MELFDHATGVTIQGSQFSQIQTQHSHRYNPVQIFSYGVESGHRNSALEALRRHAKASAAHDSCERSEAPRCYPGTRLAVLDDIESWIQGANQRPRSHLLWLLGAAGSGKTAVAQTLAEGFRRFRDQGILILSYFISASSSLAGSEQVQTTIHTIAYQLCTPPSTLSQYILHGIHGDPTIFSKELKLQMEQLIIRPFREACQANPFLKFTTRLIIIDGLDSCGTVKEQQLLVSLFMDAIIQNDLPLHLFITSRPEPHTATILDRYSSCVRQIVLDATSSSADIAHFVRSSFHELVHRRYHVAERAWPAKEDVTTIVERSSDQFLYASDVVTYVCSTPHGAESRLREVLEPRKSHCILPRVDAVFKQLLESVEPQRLDDVLDTLAWMAVYGGYITVTDRANLLENVDYPLFSFPWLGRVLGQPPSRVLDSFDSLHSLFDVPDHPESRRPLRLYHASMFEFLADEARAGELFFMDEAAAHGRIVGCMARRLHVQRGHGGPSLVSMTEDLDELRWAEKVFRCHLVQARPTEELVRSVEALAGLGRQQSQKPQSTPSRSIDRLDIVPVYTFTCDTKRTIVCFLKVTQALALFPLTLKSDVTLTELLSEPKEKRIPFLDDEHSKTASDALVLQDISNEEMWKGSLLLHCWENIVPSISTIMFDLIIFLL